MSKGADITLDDILRAHRLATTPYAIAILNALECGTQPRSALPTGTADKAIDDATQVLEQADLICTGHQRPGADKAMTLTPRGQRLIAALHEPGHDN